MFALKVILYYLAFTCIFVPIFTSVFRLNETKEEQASKMAYPWKLMQGVFYAGLALLTIAVVPTLCY